MKVVPPEEIKKRFGEEYPAAIIVDGVRVPLHHESRFSRSYHSDEFNTTYVKNRFSDGSAAMTAVELRREWPSWTKDLQRDFCQNCRYLFGQPDFPDMLHFVMQRGDPEHWAATALQIAYCLPQQEAFDFLVQALEKSEIPRSSNIIQGIAETKHPSAESVLRKHLAMLWAHPALWEDAKFLNWVAAGATNCIAYLIELAASPADFVEQARRLSRHICFRNREKCQRRLSKHYPEINTAN
jgi:hypothetical protein